MPESVEEELIKEKNDIVASFLESSHYDFSSFLFTQKIWIFFSSEDINQINQQKEFINEIEKKQWTANQHYVPQFYLRLFTNISWRVETLDIKNKRLLKSQSTERICSDTYFYSMKTGEADIVSQLLENIFCYHENNFAEIYEDLVDDIINYWKISDTYLYELCTFVTISMIRWKYFRKQLEDSHSEIMKRTAAQTYRSKKLHNPDDPEVKKISSDEKLEERIIKWEYDIKMTNIEHIQFINDEKNIRGFSNLLFNKKIRIYISDWTRNFVTSDCCIAEVIPQSRSVYWVHFMERLHYFVLSPQILIEFSDNNQPWKKIKRQRIWKSKIMFYNLIRSMYGSFLYSKSKDDLIQEELEEAFVNNIDLLSTWFPSQFQDTKETIDELKSQAKEIWLSYKSNIDLLNIVLNR